MTESVADILADVDDPKTIEKVLELSQSDRTADGQTDPSEMPTLQELYDRYLARRRDRSPATRAQYRRTLPKFIEFAKNEGVTTPAGISTSLIDAYVDQLQEQYDTDSTILTYTKNVRSWLRWLNRRDQCEDAVYQILDEDELGLNPRARDEALPEGEANTILGKLRHQRRGSLKHALLELLWNAGLRLGGAHSLDIRDFDPANSEVRLRHRPQSGTRLKNGSEDENTAGDGERNVALCDQAVEAIEWYLDHERPNVTDEFGREPLFATTHGRATRSTLRRRVYEATGCRWRSDSSEDCSCDGSCDPDSDICDYSYYPHAIRRGAIVRHLSGGLQPAIASERFDVSIKTIRKHYDPRTKRRRKEDRSNAVKSAWNG